MALDLTIYQRAGYGCVFVETMEIKRTIKEIYVDPMFSKKLWSPLRGMIDIESGNIYNFAKDEQMNPIEILYHCVGRRPDGSFETPPLKTTFILENFDEFLENTDIIQTILDIYELLKANGTMLVIVGSDSSAIPTKIREFIPVIEFGLPTKQDVRRIAKDIADSSLQVLGDEYADKFEITDTIIEACLGLTWEEIENALAKSAIETKSFDLFNILERKQMVIKKTGFMQFLNPEPIENLGGMEEYKEYIDRRKEPFVNQLSKKPKVRAILFVGYPGTGKTLAVKATCSLLNWPGLILDVGSLKEGIVGETEKKMRKATFIIDGFGKCVVCLDEIEKFFGSDKGVSDSGVSAGMLGYMLTWMQERTSEGILIATANDLSKLPPEFKRAGGRWDTIFFANLPNPAEVKHIIEIHNRKWHSELPTDHKFCEQLNTQGWSGAEIEQLAKDIHYEDDLETAMKRIPILSQYEKERFEQTRQQAKLFRHANAVYTGEKTTVQLKKRKLQYR
jgi:SpoVK/Ycf46/Vps4 family AAA+-type ATPase